MKGFSGIYKIINLITEDFYIGQAINLRQRKTEHFSRLKRGKHHNHYLQNSFNKHGEENFKFEILLFCEIWELTRYEQGLVDRLKPIYNSNTVCVTSRLGILHSEETKQKMSEKAKGNIYSLGAIHSEESKQKSSESNKGQKRSEETRQRLSESHKGKTLTEESIRKRTESRKGIKVKPPSKETRQKMSNAKKGKPLSEEHRKNISKSGLGRKYSEESKQKMRKPKSEEAKKNMSIAQKESWARRKQSQQENDLTTKGE
jgi:group I intron endonuclease